MLRAPRSLSHTHLLNHTPSHTCSLSLSLSLSHTHTHTLALSLSLSLSLSLFLYRSLFSLPFSLDHSHSLSPYLSPKVVVTLKEHQRTGEETTGIVMRLLTNSANHPRGIKVSLNIDGCQ